MQLLLKCHRTVSQQESLFYSQFSYGPLNARLCFMVRLLTKCLTRVTQDKVARNTSGSRAWATF